MCVPLAVMAAASLAASVVGGGVAAVGAIQQGHAQAASYNYQSQVAKQNANVAAANAASEQQASDKAQGQQQQKVAAFAGNQRAQMGAGNIDLTSGSAYDVQKDTQTLGQSDVENIRDSYYNRIRGDAAQESSFLNNSVMDTTAGKNAKTAGYIGAASSLIGSAATVGSKWAGYQQQGVL